LSEHWPNKEDMTFSALPSTLKTSNYFQKITFFTWSNFQLETWRMVFNNPISYKSSISTWNHEDFEMVFAFWCSWFAPSTPDLVSPVEKFEELSWRLTKQTEDELPTVKKLEFFQITLSHLCFLCASLYRAMCESRDRLSKAKE
jgi:hypothetical protein